MPLSSLSPTLTMAPLADKLTARHRSKMAHGTDTAITTRWPRHHLNSPEISCILNREINAQTQGQRHRMASMDHRPGDFIREDDAMQPKRQKYETNYLPCRTTTNNETDPTHITPTQELHDDKRERRGGVCEDVVRRHHEMRRKTINT